MKTIGLIGGMSWESTLTYYELVNKGINDKLKKNHSAKCIIYSFDFQEIEELQYNGNWNKLHELMLDAARKLKCAGTDYIALCTNTMHKVVTNFHNEIDIPLIHIADAVGQAIIEKGFKTIALLGTIFTMEESFYKDILKNKYGLSVLIPNAEDRQIINTIIYNELVKGVITDSSRNKYYSIMDRLFDAGAEGVILGCTEIGMLIKQYKIPLFDSTQIHADNIIKHLIS